MEVKLMPQGGVEKYAPEIERLLRMLGHPEALVTDESGFLDFLSVLEFGALSKAQDELDRLTAHAGLPFFDVDSTLLQAAKTLRVMEKAND